MKAIFFSLIFIALSKTINAQQYPTAYLYKNVFDMSKDSVIKSGGLQISDTNYIITSFTYVLTTNTKTETPYPAYGINKGASFTEKFLDQLTKYPKVGTLLITDVVVMNKHNRTEQPKALKQPITINFN